MSTDRRSLPMGLKVPILLGHGFWGLGLRSLPSYGWWSMAHASRTDFAMLLGSLFLVVGGAGPLSIDGRLAHILEKRNVRSS